MIVSVSQFYKNKNKKIFQVVDHCSIPILISGTYVPFALCVLEPAKPGLGWTLFGVVCIIKLSLPG